MAGKNSVFVNNSAPSVDDVWLNLQQNEGNNIIIGSGQSLSDAINNQRAIGVSRFAANNFYIDSGSADSYVLTLAASMTNPVSATVGYFVGMTIRFRAGNANTGASTVNINSAGVKNLKKADGSTDLEAGDIPTDRDVMFRYDGTSFVLIQNTLDASTIRKGISYIKKRIIVSNNATDANHDLDFTAGNVVYSDGSGVGYIGAQIRAELDVAFGTANGILKTTDTFTSNETYHLFAIFDTTGINTPKFYASRTYAESPPSGYDKIGWVMAVTTDGSSNIRRFYQDSKNVEQIPAITAYTATTGIPTTFTDLQIPTPNGLRAKAIFTAFINAPGAASRTATIKDKVSLKEKDVCTSFEDDNISPFYVYTNTSNTIQHKLNASTTDGYSLVLQAWEIPDELY